MNRSFHHFGAFVGRHPRSVLFAWAIAIGLGVWGAAIFHDRRAKRHLRSFRQSVERRRPRRCGPSSAIRSSSRSSSSLRARARRRRTPASATGTNRLRTALRALPVVKEVAAYADHRDPQLRSTDGHDTILLGGPQGNRRPGTAARGADRAGGDRAVAGTTDGARSAGARCRDRRAGRRLRHQYVERGRAAIVPKSAHCR